MPLLQKEPHGVLRPFVFVVRPQLRTKPMHFYANAGILRGVKIYRTSQRFHANPVLIQDASILTEMIAT